MKKGLGAAVRLEESIYPPSPCLNFLVYKESGLDFDDAAVKMGMSEPDGLQIVEEEIPEPGRGEVRVKVLTAGEHLVTCCGCSSPEKGFSSGRTLG